jgi:DNA repair protein RAD50
MSWLSLIQLATFRYTKALESIKSLRKDRVAEFQVDKERLEGLSREKARADQTKDRISNLSASISRKEIERDKYKEDQKHVDEANRNLNELASKFRQVYQEVEIQTQKKNRLIAEREEIEKEWQELPGKLCKTHLSLFSYSIRVVGRTGAYQG